MKIINIIPSQYTQRRKRPFFLSRVCAGFPSPADDYLDRGLDLNEFLIQHPAATFFIKVSGDSMINAGIRSGDILIVDRSLEPGNGKVVVAVINGEFTVKRLRRRQGRMVLEADNEHYQPIEITEGIDFEVWGVVAHVIRSLDKGTG